MLARDAENLCKRLMAEHGLNGWKFVWIASANCFGRCWYKRRVIELSKPLVQANGIDQVRDTILHEIAHALAGQKAGHGKLWKMVAARIGAKPERCFTYGINNVNPPSSGGYIGQCKCPGSRHYRQTVIPGMPYTCKTCKCTFFFKKQI